MAKQLNRIILLALALIMIMGSVVPALASTTNKKSRVEKVNKLKLDGIIEGREDGKLDLDAPITRAELLKIILYSMGYEKDAERLKGKARPFDDVGENHWASGIIALGKTLKMANGVPIINGYPDGSFKPDEYVTAAEAIKMIFVASDEKLTASDLNKAKFPEDYVRWAEESKIIGEESGISIDTISLNQPIKRGETFEILYNGNEYKEVVRAEKEKEKKEAEKKVKRTERQTQEPDRRPNRRPEPRPEPAPVPRPEPLPEPAPAPKPEPAPEPIPKPEPAPAVDKAALKAAISSAGKIEKDGYTTDSFEALVQALNKAKAVNQDANATQEQVNNAVQVLKAAIEGLEKASQEPEEVNHYKLMVWKYQLKDGKVVEDSYRNINYLIDEDNNIPDEKKGSPIDVTSEDNFNSDHVKVLVDRAKEEGATFFHIGRNNPSYGLDGKQYRTAEEIQDLLASKFNDDFLFDGSEYPGEITLYAVEEIVTTPDSEKPTSGSATIQFDSAEIYYSLSQLGVSAWHTGIDVNKKLGDIENIKKIIELKLVKKNAKSQEKEVLGWKANDYNKVYSATELLGIRISDLVIIEEDEYVVKLSPVLGEVGTEPINPEINKTELVKAITIAKTKVKEDYTVESYRILESALEKAEEVIKDEDATQNQVDQAKKALDIAIEGLIELKEEPGILKNYVLEVWYCKLDNDGDQYAWDDSTVKSFKVTSEETFGKVEIVEALEAKLDEGAKHFYLAGQTYSSIEDLKDLKFSDDLRYKMTTLDGVEEFLISRDTNGEPILDDKGNEIYVIRIYGEEPDPAADEMKTSITIDASGIQRRMKSLGLEKFSFKLSTNSIIGDNAEIKEFLEKVKYTDKGEPIRAWSFSYDKTPSFSVEEILKEKAGKDPGSEPYNGEYERYLYPIIDEGNVVPDQNLIIKYSINIDGGEAYEKGQYIFSPDKILTEAEEGDEVRIRATDTEKNFERWEVISGGVSIAEPTEQDTSFTMGTEDVVIKVVYEEIDTPSPGPEADKALVRFTKNPLDLGLVVKDGDDEVVAAEADGTYKLGEGLYAYTASKPGYKEQSKYFEVTADDLKSGEKTIDITLVEETAQVKNYKLMVWKYQLKDGEVVEDSYKNINLLVDQDEGIPIDVTSEDSFNSAHVKPLVDRAKEEGATFFHIGKNNPSYGLDGKQYRTAEEIQGLLASNFNDDLQYDGSKYPGDITLYAVEEIGSDPQPQPGNPEEDVSKDALGQLLQEAQNKLSTKQIQEDKEKPFRILIGQTMKVMNNQKASQKAIDTAYNALKAGLENYSLASFDGKANIYISGWREDGKELKGKMTDANTMLVIKLDGYWAYFTGYFNKIEDYDLESNGNVLKVKFDEFLDGVEPRIYNNGQEIIISEGVKNSWGGTEEFSIPLNEGPNNIVVDYRKEASPFNTMVSTSEALELIEKNKTDSKFVIFDVRSSGEFNESHIEGAITSDWYHTEEFNDYLDGLDQNKTYLVYCRTQNRSEKAANLMEDKGFKYIYWMKGGMTDWLKENRPYTVMSEVPRKLDLELIPLTSVEDEMKVSISVKNLMGDNMVKSSVSLDIYKDGEFLETKNVKMANQEKQEFSYEIDGSGVYEIKARASLDGYQEGLTSLVWDKDRPTLEGYETAKDKGKFDHLIPGSKEAEAIEKVYGRYFKKYQVLDFDVETIAIEEIDGLDKNKPSLMVLGYPGCGGCVEMMQEISYMMDMPACSLKDQLNYLEIITSVDETNPDNVISFTREKLGELGLDNIIDHVYFDGVDGIWANRLGLTTTPNVVLLDEYGRIVNISHQLKPNELKELIQTSLGLDIGQVPDPVSETASITIIGGSASPEKAKAGETVTITALDNGRVFLGWEVESGGVRLDNPQAKETTFTMGSDPVIIQAKYEKTLGERLTFAQRMERGEYSHFGPTNPDLARIKEDYGTSIKDLTVIDIDGNSVKLSETTDGVRPTLVMVGSTTCGACKNKWENMAKYVEENSIDISGYNLIYLVQDSFGGSIASFQSEIKAELSRTNSEIIQPYFYFDQGNRYPLRVPGVPMTFIFDKEGNFTSMPGADDNGINSIFYRTIESIPKLIGDSISVKQ